MSPIARALAQRSSAVASRFRLGTHPAERLLKGLGPLRSARSGNELLDDLTRRIADPLDVVERGDLIADRREAETCMLSEH